MYTLPQVVLDEIFNLEFKVSDQAIEYISDELDKFGCVISNSFDYDMSVIIMFYKQHDKSHPYLEGELRIDRIQRRFEICVKYGEETVLPAFGDWDLIIEYLVKVLEA